MSDKISDKIAEEMKQDIKKLVEKTGLSEEVILKIYTMGVLTTFKGVMNIIGFNK